MLEIVPESRAGAGDAREHVAFSAKMPQLSRKSLKKSFAEVLHEVPQCSAAVWVAGAAHRARHHFLLTWLPQARALRRRHAGLFCRAWPARIFCLCCGCAGSVWRTAVDAGTVYAPRRTAASR